MKKKLISSLLAISMLASLGATAFAQGTDLDEPVNGGINTPGGSSSVPVELNVTPLTFSVTVPSGLPINVDADGNVEVANNVKITNNSAGMVKVKNVEVSMLNGWSLDSFDVDFTDKAVNTKQLGLVINGVDANLGNLKNAFGILAVDDSEDLVYDAKIPPQSESLQSTIANLIFTIGWVDSEVLEGDGQTYHKIAPSELSFRSTSPIDEFKELKVNGQVVDPSNYTLTEGSTIVTLNVDYLDTLDATGHSIEIVSENKSGQGRFLVDDGGFNSTVGFWYDKPYIMALNGAGVGIMMHRDNFLYYVEFDLSSNEYFIQKVPYVIENGTLKAMGYVLQGTDDENIVDIYLEEDGPEGMFNLWFYEEACLSEGEYFYSEPWAAFFGNPTDYDAQVLDRDKEYYQPILTGVNGVVVETNGTYRDCVNMKEIVIPYGITFIGDDCFENCVSLTKVTLPKSIERIYNTAFTGCTSLTSIKFNGTMEDWNNLDKDTNWNKDVPATQVRCSDGIVNIK